MPKSLPFLFLLLLLYLAACHSPQSEGQLTENGPLIVCTTGMIADMAQAIAGEQAQVKALMGPGVDPHLYKATQGDLKLLRAADLIVYNGHHLEGKMSEILEAMGNQGYQVLALAECLPETELIKVDDQGTIDPHIWFDVELWAKTSNCIEQSLVDILPDDETRLSQRADSLRIEWTLLDDSVRYWMEEIPAERRVLVTAHDAFAYFGRAYGVEVLGLQGISTISEAGLKDITVMVDQLVERKIPAVFIESSVSSRDLEAVVEACRAKGHPLRIGATLYSDAMGASDSPEGSYAGMVRYNAQRINESLR